MSRPNPLRTETGYSQASTLTPSVIESQYIKMLLAQEHISLTYNLLAAGATWLMLGGFIVLPGSFGSLGKIVDQKVSDEALKAALKLAIDHVPVLYVGTACSLLALIVLFCLWLRWRMNYVWLRTNIFVPGFLNSSLGVLASLVNIFLVNGGQFNRRSRIVLYVVSGICGGYLVLLVIYVVIIDRAAKKHEAQHGKHGAGKRGEGRLKEPAPDHEALKTDQI
ncbi:hypothetical protein DFP72DRAFT_804881 [Ephemerocybe angulata]|uniref:Uncharacterized protein n=1 Tax=Ephemerocybe angulata TaxID=980116 RepID=A0A8H6ME32_9AGAR|nr:hypothetical protein DFP72DRAFT_804881 [Tulosesus angulatus]